MAQRLTTQEIVRHIAQRRRSEPIQMVVAWLICLTSHYVAGPATSPATETPATAFALRVVDRQTTRGVPLVELTTVSGVRFITDSAGYAAIDDPALLGHPVYFSVTSHGYLFRPDGFGNHGQTVDLTPGGNATLPIDRINIAQRLYRITGEGIYRDSVMLGKSAPIREPLLNGGVVGQDSAQTAVYRDRIYWFWGDTNRQRYPLGHFWTSGATSALKGLQPDNGIDLDYFVDREGFCRPMVDHVDNNPLWLDGLTVVADEHGRPRMVGVFSKMKSVSECVGRLLVAYDDAAEKFVRVADVPEDAAIFLRGHPFHLKVGGEDYCYFGDSFPNMRVPAKLSALTDWHAYEGFTPLVKGSRVKPNVPLNVERQDGGRAVWDWKRDTPPLTAEQARQTASSPRDGMDPIAPNVVDVDTARAVLIHNGSARWSEFRKRWILIATELHGATSELGEIWYAEAAKPEGPWHAARKIITHDRYSFYNPVQHDFLDEDGGRVIYFEGTYTNTFSRDGQATPRYDYNQLMYRLDLSDERLRMPE